MKKTILILLLAAALLLAGCGTDRTQPQPTTEPTSAPTAAPTNTPAPTPVPTPAPPEKSELPGSLDKRTYTNTFFGVGCTLEPNWTYYTKDQIAELNEMAQEKMDETTAAAWQEALANGETLVCMAAASNKRNLNLTVQAAADMDTATVLYSSAEELRGVLESMGMKTEEVSAETVFLAGGERPCLRITGTFPGPLIEQTLCIRAAALEAWGYIAVVTAAAPTAEETDAIFAAWFALETE